MVASTSTGWLTPVTSCRRRNGWEDKIEPFVPFRNQNARYRSPVDILPKMQRT